MFFRGVFIVRSKVIGYGWGLLLLSSCQIGMGPPSYIPERVLQTSTKAPVISPALTSPVPSPSVSTGEVSVPLEPAPSAIPAGTDNQPLPQASSSTGSAPVVSGVLSGTGSSGGGSSTVDHNFHISDVVLTETGESIMGADSPAEIHADYTLETPISLKLQGKFSGLSSLALSASSFSYEAGLKYQTHQDNAPRFRVLLDNVLILEIINFSETHLEVLLPQQYLSELYLQGLHTLSVTAEEKTTQASINVGRPNINVSSFPQIDSVEQITTESFQGLTLEGYFLLLNPAWQTLSINNTRVSIERIDILSDGRGILFSSLPEALSAGEYVIQYTSSFGVTYFVLVVD
jgi:hypothetical protein